MMNHHNGRQYFPLSKSIQEEQVVDTVFDSTAGIANVESLWWLKLEMSRRN